MANLYCTQCSQQLAYHGEGVHTCTACGYKKYYGSFDADALELHLKAEWYQRDGQYFNALQMYDIILKADEGDFCACYGAVLAEFGARYLDHHDGTYELVCERTHAHSVYESEYYKKLVSIAPDSAMEIFSPVIAELDSEQKKNNEQYLASAPVDEKKDYREEARESEQGLADDYLSAREKYLKKQREEEEEAERRRLEAKEREEAAQRARENRAILARKKARKKKIAIISIASVLALLIVLSVAFFIVVPSVRLAGAKADIEAGRYDDAARTLRAIEEYSDSGLLLSQYRLYGLGAGDVVKFGEYEQDGVAANGPEALEWIVLESTDTTVTLISKYVIDCVMYHENKDAPAYWHSASLRAWLGGEFYENAFSDSERGMLALVTNQNPDNDRCGTKGGETTEDRVYVLSIDEAEKYLDEDSLVGVPTQYSLDRGVYDKGEYEGVYWWLRSPGATQNSAAKVNCDGKIDIRGSGVNYSSYGVRPSITLTKAVIE